MRLYFVLFLFFISWQIRAQDNDEIEVIYDTVLIEKPPVYLDKTIYYTGTKENANNFFIQGSLGFEAFGPDKEQVKDTFLLTNKNARAIKFEIKTGYHDNFFQYSTGISFAYFKTDISRLSFSWHKDTSYVEVQDTLDSYYSVKNGDTTWHYITVWNTEQRVDSSQKEYNDRVRYYVVSIPFLIGYPMYYKKIFFNPQMGITANFFRVKGENSGEEIRQAKKVYVRPGINFLFDVGYQILDNKYIFSQLYYSLYPGQRSRENSFVFNKSYGLDFGIKFIL